MQTIEQAIKHNRSVRASVRRAVWERDDGYCVVCGLDLTNAEWHLGHKVDHAVGGSNEVGNLAVMCPFCNLYKKPAHHTIEEYEAWVVAERQRNRDLFWWYDGGRPNAMQLYFMVGSVFAELSTGSAERSRTAELLAYLFALATQDRLQRVPDGDGILEWSHDYHDINNGRPLSD